MAEYCPMWARHCYELPDSVSFEEAALLDPLQVAVHAIDVSALRAGDTFVVFGLGPVGLSCLQIARIRGARVMVGTDVYPRPLEIARELGATLALNTREADAVTAIHEATEGMGADVVVDTVGSPQSFAQELSVLARGGTLVTLAVHPGEYRFDGLAIGAERSIKTTSNCLFKDYQRSLDLVTSGLARMKPMITHRCSLEEVPDAFDLLARKEGSGAVKIIVVPS
jgi:L-iditol 2-dehydrogenase